VRKWAMSLRECDPLHAPYGVLVSYATFCLNGFGRRHPCCPRKPASPGAGAGIDFVEQFLTANRAVGI